jgi:preprotein translocase subunit SecY
MFDLQIDFDFPSFSAHNGHQRTKIDMALRNPLQNGSKRELAREITVTLLLIVLYRVGVQIPIPFVNENALMHFFGGKSFERISVFALGLMPYISAYILVEIGSLFVPFLKKLRRGDYTGRRKLRGYALWMTLVIAVFQSTMIVKGIARMASPAGVPVLEVGSFYEYAIVLLVLTGGVFLLILVAELISRYGIGNGVSIILLTGICAGFSRVAKSERFAHEVGLSLHPFLIFFMLVLLTVILVKTQIGIPVSHGGLGEPVTFFQLNTCPSGNVAIGYASSLIFLPLTVSHFLNGGDYFTRILFPRGLMYYTLLVIFIFVFSYLFACLFFHPKRRYHRMSERGWQISEGGYNALKSLYHKLLIYNFPWTVLLCVFAIVPRIVTTQFDGPLYIAIGGSTLFLLVAISIDVWDRLNVFRKTKPGKLCKVAELHDVYDASMIRRHMESEEIICHFQGYYHRRLLYFFGPYVDISVKVAERDRQSAEELLRKYYNGLGLLKEQATKA